MKKFSIRQLFSYGIAVLTQKFAAFIILPIVAANLSVEDFGLANQIISIGGFYILIVMLGLDESIAKKGFDSESSKDEYIANGFFLLALNTTAFAVIAYFFSDIFYNSLIENASNTIIVISIILICCTPFYLVYLKILRLSNNSKEFFIVVVCQVIVQSGLLLFFVVHMSFGAKGFLMSHAMTMVFCCLYVIFRLRRVIRRSFISSRVTKELYSYGGKIAPQSIASWGLWGLCVVFTGKYLGSEFSAQLVAVNYIPLIANVISFAFFYTYQPWLYENLKKKVNVKVIKKNLVVFVFAFLLTLSVIYLLSKYIFGLLFDERYSIDMTLVVILLFASFFQFIGSLFTYILYYFESVTKYVGVSTISGGLLNLVLLIVLSNKYGLVGVGLAFMLAQFMIMVVRGGIANVALLDYKRRIKLELES